MKTSHRWVLVGALAAAGAGSVGAFGVGLLAWYSLHGSAPGWRKGDGWRTHTDPVGFTVDVPSTWKVQSDAASGRVDLQGPSGERVVAWPVYSAAALQTRSAGAIASRMARRLWPEGRWSAVETVAPRAVRVRASTASARGICLLTWVTSARGSAAFVYLLRAPDEAKDVEARFARIVSSFRLVGGKAAVAERGERFEPWVDPGERAFSVEIPAGWRTTGGAVRPNPLIVQARLDATSPDGQTVLHLGDAYPVYLEPSAMLSMGGIGPGGTYPDPMAGPTPVASYMPGIDYALRVVLPSRVGSFRRVARADRPDVAGRLARLGINRYDAGEAQYSFDRAGREYRGWALCITERVAAPAMTHWHVWRLYLVEAPADRFESGKAALLHVASTFRIDPAWAERQARLTAEQSRILGEMGQAVSQTIEEAHDARQATLDEIHRRGANVRRQVEEVVDGHTGRAITVDSGSSYYWVDDRGVIVGTETDTRPSLDFRELTRLP